MKQIHIDFAPDTVKRSVLRTKPVSWLLAAIGLILCLSASVKFVLLAQQHTRSANEERIQEIRAEGIKQQSVQSLKSISSNQKNAINNAIAQLNLPWRDLLDALEAATPANVALLTIEPESRTQIVKGMAESKTSSGMIAYIELLKKQEFFKTVVLTKHEINEQDANKPYRFQFEAQWGSLQ